MGDHTKLGQGQELHKFMELHGINSTSTAAQHCPSRLSVFLAIWLRAMLGFNFLFAVLTHTFPIERRKDEKVRKVNTK